MKGFILIICTLLFFSCQDKKNNPRNNNNETSLDSVKISVDNKDLYEASFNIGNYITKVAPTDDEITFINENCCIFIDPDSAQIAEMKGKSKEDEENFYTVADDFNFYSYEASKFLDSIHLKRIYPHTRYLNFIMSDDSILIDTKSKISRGWITILFNTNKKPKIVSPVNLDLLYNDFIKE
jgi:hypothetical protein